MAAPQDTPQVTSHCCRTGLEKLLTLGWKIHPVGQGDSLIPSSERFFFLFVRDPHFPAAQLLLQTHMEPVSVGDCSGLQLQFLNCAQKLQRGDCISLKETAFPPVPARLGAVLGFNLASAFESWMLI